MAVSERIVPAVVRRKAPGRRRRPHPSGTVSRRPALLIAAALATAVGAAVPARAATGQPVVRLSMAFGNPRPASASGLHLDVTIGSSAGSAAKPPALRTAVFDLPAGAVLDTAVVARCTASDQAIDLEGSLACPPASRIGTGTVSAYTGLGAPIDPLVGQDDVFNGPGEIIEVVTAPGTPLSPGHDRLTIDGDTLTAHPPVLPGGPPDGHTSIGRIDFTVPVITTAAGPYLRTPGQCPTSGEWTTAASFTFVDGTTATATASTPCTSG